MTGINLPTNVRYSLPLELKAAEGVVVGYASAWGGPPDHHGDIVIKGAFTGSLKKRVPVMLWSHNLENVIGKWTEVREDEIGLFVRGHLNANTREGREAFERLRHGDISGASIGFKPSPIGEKKNLDGSKSLSEVELYEISLVTVPANDRARVQLESKRDLQDLLHKSGLSKAAASKIANGGWGALVTDEAAPANLETYAQRIMRSAHKLRNG